MPVGEPEGVKKPAHFREAQRFDAAAELALLRGDRCVQRGLNREEQWSAPQAWGGTSADGRPRGLIGSRAGGLVPGI